MFDDFGVVFEEEAFEVFTGEADLLEHDEALEVLEGVLTDRFDLLVHPAFGGPDDAPRSDEEDGDMFAGRIGLISKNVEETEALEDVALKSFNMFKEVHGQEVAERELHLAIVFAEDEVGDDGLGTDYLVLEADDQHVLGIVGDVIEGMVEVLHLGVVGGHFDAQFRWVDLRLDAVDVVLQHLPVVRWHLQGHHVQSLELLLDHHPQLLRVLLRPHQPNLRHLVNRKHLIHYQVLLIQYLHIVESFVAFPINGEDGAELVLVLVAEDFAQKDFRQEDRDLVFQGETFGAVLDGLDGFADSNDLVLGADHLHLGVESVLAVPEQSCPDLGQSLQSLTIRRTFRQSLTFSKSFKGRRITDRVFFGSPCGPG